MSSGNNEWWDSIAKNADILNNIANNLIPVQRLITGAAYIIGLAFAFKAIYTLKVYGESKTMMSHSGNLKEPIIYLLVAGIFIYFPTGLAAVLQTTFGYSSVIDYREINTKLPGIGFLWGSGSVVGRALTIIIQTVGGIAFVRGWILLARSAGQGQPPGGTGKGLVHIFGGILAINIVGTLEIINNTIYGSA